MKAIPIRRFEYTEQQIRNTIKIVDRKLIGNH